MITYGIVIEGKYDEAALKEIILKCLPKQIRIVSRICGDKDRLIADFSGHLESFRYGKHGSNVDKALVIRDADGKDPNELEEKMRNKISGRAFPFDVKFVIIVQELETWLLADEDAISRVTMSRSGRSVSRVNQSLESITQPKEMLGKILIEARVPYTDAVALEIAKESDLDKIQYRCPGFRKFHQAVIDC